jgi:hypothetical protein
MHTRTLVSPLARRLLAGPAGLVLGSLVLLPPADPQAMPGAQERGCLTRSPGFWASQPAITAHARSDSRTAPP